MAEQNPIKYSDLIVPDDSIEKLVKQLTDVKTVFDGLATDIKTSAAAIRASMQTVSGATEQGRASTRGAATDADRLTKAYKDLAFARSETARKIAELKAQQKEEQDITKLEIKLANSAAGSYNALSAQYSLNMMALNNLTDAERKNLPYAKKLEEETKKIYEEMDRLQQATGKYSLNVGNYENSINKAIGAQSHWFQEMQKLGALFEGGLSSGIKTASTAVAGFGKQLLALLANPIVATIAAVTAAIMALAKGISSSEENTHKLNIVLAPFERILTAVVSVLQTMAGFLLDVVAGLEDMTMWLSRQLEKLPLVGSAIRSVNNALEENIALEKEKAQLELDRRSTNVRTSQLRAMASQYKNLAAAARDEHQKEVLLGMARARETEAYKANLEWAQRNLEVKRREAKQKQNDKKANEELAQAEIDLANAEEQYFNRTRKINTQLSNLHKETPTKTPKPTKDTSEEDALRELEARQKRELEAIRKYQDSKVALIEDDYDRSYVQTELQYEREIEDLKAQMAKLGDEEVTAKKAIDETIVNLEQQKWNKLAAIRDKQMQDAVNAEQKDYEARIKATDKLIKEQERLEKENAQKEKEMRENAKDAAREAADITIENIRSVIDSWVQLAEAKRRQADEDVSAAQRSLEAEIEARNLGYANDVETARKELELAKQTQKKAIEEQKRAQQAQELIDTATQTSSLITATANIWASLSAIPIVGYILAIGAIAAMWGSFAAAKVKAHQVAGSDEAYGEGTVELLEGGSHQSGHDIDLGRKKDGTRRRAEGGEFFAIINKRNSRRYRDVIPDVINSLNDGTFAQKYMGAYDGGVMVNVGGQRTDLRELTDSVNDIRDQGRTRRYVDASGREVTYYKNVKRVVKNAN